MPSPAQSPFSEATQAKIKSQILRDPGLPHPDPTIPTWQIPPHRIAATKSHTLCPSVDFANIGSGVTGCSVAHNLLADSRSENQTVVVFEARTVASGATGRNAGFLQSHVPKQFQSLVDNFGLNEAMAIAKFCKRTLLKMHELNDLGGLELSEASELRKVKCAAVFHDESVLDAGIASIKQYEDAFPEAKVLHSVTQRTGSAGIVT